MDQIPKKIKMISKKLKELKNKFYRHKIDGYVVPKNDEYFSEFAKKDKLKTITGFDGSFGLAIILKKKIRKFPHKIQLNPFFSLKGIVHLKIQH